MLRLHDEPCAYLDEMLVHRILVDHIDVLGARMAATLVDVQEVTNGATASFHVNHEGAPCVSATSKHSRVTGRAAAQALPAVTPMSGPPVVHRPS